MKSAMEHLQSKGFEDARLNVELLLAHALDLQRIQLYLDFDRPLNPEELKQFRILYERRLKREPIQYIIGSTSFMGLHFSVDARVLIHARKQRLSLNRRSCSVIVIQLLSPFKYSMWEQGV